MRLSNLAKYFPICLLILFVQLGCGWFDPTQNTAAPTAVLPPSDTPFLTREPENFTAMVVVTSGGVESRFFLVRSGIKRRTDFNFESPGHISYIVADARLVASHDQKIYTERESGAPGSGPSAEDMSLTRLLLAERTYSSFEQIGAEGGTTSYRARLAEDQTSEIIIYIDEAVGIPVRQEFFSTRGGERQLQLSIEVRDLKLEADQALFDVPPGFRKVPSAEFYRVIRSAN